MALIKQHVMCTVAWPSALGRRAAGSVAQRLLIALSLLSCVILSHQAWDPRYLSRQAVLNRTRTKMLIILKTQAQLQVLKKMCNGLHDEQSCNLEGVCERFFESAIIGMSADVHQGHLDTIETCIPGGIKYAEPDAEVRRTDGDHHAEWWKATPPPNSGAEPKSRPKRYFSVDGKPDSAYTNDKKKWMLRQIGLQAQKELGQLAVARAQERTVQELSPDFNVKGNGLFDENDLPDVHISSTPDGVSAASILRPGLKTEKLNEALWNLDRIDQHNLPLSGTYNFGSATSNGTGSGVTIYSIDSGVRISHQEFRQWTGNGSRGSYGYDFVDNDWEAEDCDGHGTHVASTALGRSVGVAKDASVVAVRVLDCSGSGSISNTVAGLDWVAKNGRTPGIITMSLGVSIGTWSQSLEDTVTSLVRDKGFVAVVASGNSAVDSCEVVPARVPDVITVAGTNLATKFTGVTGLGDVETIYRWSNTGKCVDIFAPGVDIYAACGGASRCEEVTDSAYTWASGTSMAVPHVAGVAAMYLSDHPTASPAEVRAAIIGAATYDKLSVAYMLPDTPNIMVYSNLTSAPQQAVAASSKAG